MKYLVFLIIFIILSCHKKITDEPYRNVDKETANYIKARNYRDAGVKDSAFYFYSISKNEFLKDRNNLGVAKSLINMAIIQTDKGDFFGGIETSLEAEDYLKSKDSITQELKSQNYNNLAIANAELVNFKESEKYYNLAINSTLDQESKFLYYNNLANVYVDLKNFDKAKRSYTIALSTKDEISFARTLNNFGKCLYLENKEKDVTKYFTKALYIRLKHQDSWGLNSSYSTLSEYFEESAPEKSKFYAKKMLETAAKIKSADDELEALQKLIKLDSKNYQKYFSRFQSLNDSLQTTRNKAKNQFALIRYDAEKNRTEFLKSVAENAQKQNQILKQNIALAILFLVIVFGFFWYKKRKKRLEQEKALEVKNTQLKYSKKIHDIVANGVYQVMTEVENAKSINKDSLLNRLEILYEKSRDISYDEGFTSTEKNFSQKILHLINSYSSPKVQIFIVGNDESFWNHLHPKIQSEIYLVIQELLTNMKKHSFAQRVSLKFEKTANNIKLSYFDDGIGIKNDRFEKKNGLLNTENRIFSCGGVLIFDNQIQKGTKIKIEIPVGKEEDYV